MRKGQTVMVTKVRSLRHLWMLGRRGRVRRVRGGTVEVFLFGSRVLTFPASALRPLGRG